MSLGPRAQMMALKTAAATDVGRRRHGNEDRHGVLVRPGEGSRPACTLLVVADGMGGARGGEVASGIAVETVSRLFLAAPERETGELLRLAIEAANLEIYSRGGSEPHLAGMGTTCTAVAVERDVVWVAHVGDSRAYRVHGRQIQVLTEDHSLVARLVEEGLLTPEQARVDPRRNVVTRGLGVEAGVEVDVERLAAPLLPGETLLVCSDGLHGLVSDQELARTIDARPLDRACRALIDLANRRGGPDNITAILARLEPAAAGS